MFLIIEFISYEKKPSENVVAINFEAVVLAIKKMMNFTLH